MRSTLPEGFQPLKKLMVCSNTITGGGQLLTIKGDFPLLIGKGAYPVVWLKGLVDNQHDDLTYVVEKNKSVNPAIKVKVKNNKITILAGSTIVLSAKATSNDVVNIDQVDLRPIGFSVYGDRSKLVVGGGTFSNNSMAGGGSLIAFG
ncbi:MULTISPECIES: hypothetical protein [Vibrio]|uniref:hypothetical protein n=1 Tax=Vibrio TaxID=662 RepID=UPI000C824B19|nr:MULTISPECIES: hypothetical protein [Vibrio]PMJ59373.1 hypothetical protein BCU23_03000 [Vibrio splendidus]TCN91958.1 hypothetical protein EDB37_1001260 [Vibrio crassostreae]